MDNIVHVGSEAAWQNIEKSSKPVFVDFWAVWCGPCRMIAPTFEKLAAKYGNDITFVKVDVDELQNVAAKFAIRSIPTLLLLRDGEVLEQVVGTRSYDDLAKLLDRYVSAAAPQ
jgi:thioredoxin 1